MNYLVKTKKVGAHKSEVMILETKMSLKQNREGGGRGCRGIPPPPSHPLYEVVSILNLYQTLHLEIIVIVV